MTELLAAEWLKMRKRWMVRIIILIMLAIIALVFWGLGTRGDQRINLFMPRGWLVALSLTSGFAPFIWPVLGGNWAGSEYNWGTVRMILSRRPDRIQWTAAALLTLIFVSGIGILLAVLLGTIAGSIIAGLTGNPAFDTAGLQSGYALIVIKCFFGIWYVLAFYVILSYAAGTVFRSGAFGIGFGIGITVAQLIVFGIFRGLGGTWRTVAEHFPYAYTNALTSRLPSAGTTGDFARVGNDVASTTESLIGLAIYMAILLAITFTAVKTRDVTS